MKKIISIILIFVFTLLLVSCIDEARKEYENDLNNALNKPYNELTREEREMANDYIEWEVENYD